jgi:hypothetical protein
LTAYLRACEFLKAELPDTHSAFIRAVEPLRTRPDFEPVVSPCLTPEMIEQSKLAIKDLSPEALEDHELDKFGRYVVHDHPFFVQMQRRFTERVSELAGEEVVPTYNFLSLYSARGVCELHLDDPTAKWTLDICIDQSSEWPIHIGPVIDWPTEPPAFNSDWRGRILTEHQFTPYRLKVGEGLLFSGSGQYHYRDPMSDGGYSHLVFFHYCTKAAAVMARPSEWAGQLGITDRNNINALLK